MFKKRKASIAEQAIDPNQVRQAIDRLDGTQWPGFFRDLLTYDRLDGDDLEGRKKKRLTVIEAHITMAPVADIDPLVAEGVVSYDLHYVPSNSVIPRAEGFTGVGIPTLTSFGKAVVKACEHYPPLPERGQ